LAASPIENAGVDESAIVKIGPENSLTTGWIEAGMFPDLVNHRINHHDSDVL